MPEGRQSPRPGALAGVRSEVLFGAPASPTAREGGGRRRSYSVRTRATQRAVSLCV